MTVSSASIVVCTYNRAALLRETLTALQALDPPRACVVELIVVDNNSTDDTPDVIAEAVRGARIPLVALHEKRQGKSFALNTALVCARGDIVALLDDDVIPSPWWLQRIVENFREREVTFVFGKVLPRWSSPTRPELLTREAQDIWGPLALIDYGDRPVDYRSADTRQRLPIGANLAFLRSVLLEVGGWRTDLGKVNNTLISGEDHEIFMRLRRRGRYAGYYDPAVTVAHYVPGYRLTRRYFRKWFFWHGRTKALMLDDLYPGLDMSRVPRIVGVPRFLYGEALRQCRALMQAAISRRPLSVMIEELRLLEYVGLFSECFRQAWRSRLSSHGPLAARIVK
jgi:glycosyltransferase involved in cell wall biosynthesis